LHTISKDIYKEFMLIEKINQFWPVWKKIR